MQESKTLTTEEINDVISNINETWDPNYDKKILAKTRGAKCGLSKTGQRRPALTDEHKEKIRQSLKGRKRPEDVVRRMKEGNTGKKRSPDAIARVIASKLGKKHSESHKKKIAEAQFKPVSINGVVYPSAKAAGLAVGIDRSCVSKFARSTSEKWKDWFYVDEPKKPT
ncbi:hypothetical protein [Burkholderia phage FLC6]|nr:hypothetical protein [Burkholderia phage FLC6]